MTNPGATEPGGAPLRGEPAPIELVNTEYAVQGEPRDGLSAPAHLGSWLAAHRESFLTRLDDDWLAQLDTRQLHQFRTLRTVVRRLVVAVVEQQNPAPADVGAVNRLSKLGVLWPRLVWLATGEPHVEMSTGEPNLSVVVGELAQQTIRLVGGPDRNRIRACRSPGCVLFFVQTQRREWCSAACGNRARVARHYQRWHGAPTRDATPDADSAAAPH